MAAWRRPRRSRRWQHDPADFGRRRGAVAGGRGALARRRRRPDARAGRADLPPAELPPLPASTTFATLDHDGNAVACALTMDNLFGTGRMLPGIGFLLAASPAAVPPPLLSPRRSRGTSHLKAFRAAVGGSGQAAAPTGGRGGAVSTRCAPARRWRRRCPIRPGQCDRLRRATCRATTASCRWATDPRGGGLAAGGN